ncbi:MAG: glycerol kinase GlpK [Pseudomonadota bacterium]
MTRTLLSIDQGTTSTRAILFSEKGEVLDIEQKELKLVFPQKGWVEQDANEIWDDVVHVVGAVLGRAKEVGNLPVCVGITNQRETTVVWDRRIYQPVYNAIVWQDRRTAEYCSQLKEEGFEEVVSDKTGLLIDPYFSGTKLRWILDNVEGVRARAEKGELAFGTVDSYVLYRLTNGQIHATDATNASRTMLYNIPSGMWDDDLLKKFNVPNDLLPDVLPNISNFGQIDASLFDVPDLHVGGMAGDQQAALIGQACFEQGQVKSTYGTGCFALMNVGSEFKKSENRLLTTIAYQIGDDVTYALEGSIFVAGAAIQWLRDNVEFFANAAESQGFAESVPDSNGVYFVPAFTGLGAPYWDPDAQALICGLTRESNKAHITRAALEAQGFQTKDLMAAMEDDSGLKLETIRADGGLVANDFVCQFLADILDCEVQVPKVAEATAWGAACLAGVQAGVFESLQGIGSKWKSEKSFSPKMRTETRTSLYDGWKQAVGMLIKN